MVTWGQNTVHTFGSPAPTPGGSTGFSFGTPSPAPAPSGGGLFGTPTPAPSGGGLFGSPAAPAPGGSLFGTPTPAPAPGGSLFGTPTPAPAPGAFSFSSPVPAPSTSLFGAPAPAPSTSLFGTPSTSSSLFGTPAPAPGFGGFSSASTFGNPAPAPPAPQAPQIPAQAALQAHLDASARQEAERVKGILESLHAAYTGAPTPPNSNAQPSKFVTIVYNDITPEQRQMQWVHGMSTGLPGSQPLLTPPKPPEVSEEEWKQAVVNNPDPHNYIPVALVGAVALQARVSWQQERATKLAEHAAVLKKSRDTLQKRCNDVQKSVEQFTRQHAVMKRRLLDVMRRVELARCLNLQIQPDEVAAMQKLVTLQRQVESLRAPMSEIQDQARNQTSSSIADVSGIPDKSQLVPVLKEHREYITKMTTTAKRDLRDIALLQQKVVSALPAPPRS